MIIKEINRADLKFKDNVFKCSSWCDIYKGKIKFFGIFNKNDEIVGDFVLQQVKMKGYTGLINPIFISNNCLQIEYPSQKQSSRITFEKRLMDAFGKFISSRKERIIDFSFPADFKDMRPFIWEKIRVKPQYTYKIDLTKPLEELFDNLSSSARANIKKARSMGFIVKPAINRNHLIRMVDNTFERQSEKYHRNILEEAISSNQLDESRLILATYDDETPLAANFVLYDQNNAFYLIGGYDHKQKHRGAMALSMWQAIELCHEKGIKSFDFQGSMIPDIEKFFRSFGGSLQTYFRVTSVSKGIQIGARILGKEL